MTGLVCHWTSLKCTCVHFVTWSQKLTEAQVALLTVDKSQAINQEAVFFMVQV